MSSAKNPNPSIQNYNSTLMCTHPKRLRATRRDGLEIKQSAIILKSNARKPLRTRLPVPPKRPTNLTQGVGIEESNLTVIPAKFHLEIAVHIDFVARVCYVMDMVEQSVMRSR